jgi:hypothetical protein
MKSIFYSLFLTVLGLIGLSACCDKSFCASQESGYQDSFFFSFLTDSTKGNAFTPQEIDTVYLRKYTKGQVSTGTIIEQLSVAQVVILGEDGTDFENYDYTITNPSRSFEFRITNLVVQGEEFSNKCSSCYYNTKKTCDVEGISYDRSGSNAYIILNKP